MTLFELAMIPSFFIAVLYIVALRGDIWALRDALKEIADMETDKANATVRRMAALARREAGL